MRTVIFVGGILRPGKAVSAAIAEAELIIAADSGAAIALKYGKTPDFIAGDFDSLDKPHLQRLIKQGSQVIRANAEKDETDTELAIQVALERGASTITLLGGIEGARFDHAIANILLLAGFAETPIHIVDGPSVCWLLRGPGSTRIRGNPGDLVSLLPLTGEAIDVRTYGLHYPLFAETLYFGRPRGVSNVLTHEEAEVSLGAGMLLIVYTDIGELERL
jgi:thiamine pyrophosphokinase